MHNDSDYSGTNTESSIKNDGDCCRDLLKHGVEVLEEAKCECPSDFVTTVFIGIKCMKIK